MTEQTNNPVPQKEWTWRDNAEEFAGLDKGDGWAFACLVACSVGRGTHVKAGKVTIPTFAKIAKASPERVRRFFDSWQMAASIGLVPDAGTLKAEDWRNLPFPNVHWSRVYAITAPQPKPKSEPKPKPEEVKKAAEEMPAADKADLLNKLAKDDAAVKESGEVKKAQLPDPDKPIIVTLPLPMQQKFLALAQERDVTYKFLVVTACVEYLKQETPPKLDK